MKKQNLRKIITMGLIATSLIAVAPMQANAFDEQTLISGKWVKGTGDNEWYWSEIATDTSRNNTSSRNVFSDLYLINGVQYGFDEDGKMVNGKVIWNADKTEATINGVVYDNITNTNVSRSDYNCFSDIPSNYYEFHVKGTPADFHQGGKFREFLVDPNTNEILIGKQVNPVNGKTYFTNYKGELLSGFQLNPFTRRWEYYNRNSGALETGVINLYGKTYNLDDSHLNEFNYFYAQSEMVETGHSDENDPGYYYKDSLLAREESEKQEYTRCGMDENEYLKFGTKYHVFNY
ncbi:hypothetical protein [Clostridium butyricum]|uniref:hypothetical protein n=1 Tax=Clostridium butyricum TaxID=1492 RepID=UPI003465667C